MQLVVMAAVLAMAGTGQGCSLGCKLANITLRVESCGVTEVIETTECSGLCHNQDPNYIGNGDMDEQKICNGDWSYEAKHINGCPVAARYPVASNCRCTTCDEDSTYCGRTPRYMPSCFSR
ncbi:Follicle-stimulating hormone beta subunit isoform 2 [Scophthalmus maximus]|nr:follicle-stimulating hormone subunit beta [Scophthalmus maximus]AWP01221.1 Follicle-stimulating hormone beta subunit isoform 2 [Scophthalmus maximus]QNU12868.1 follicle stimulating hormone subunit beta protein [Scophthalmus maximus]